MFDLALHADQSTRGRLFCGRPILARCISNGGRNHQKQENAPGSNFAHDTCSVVGQSLGSLFIQLVTTRITKQRAPLQGATPSEFEHIELKSIEERRETRLNQPSPA